MSERIAIEAAQAPDLAALVTMIENCYRGDHARMGWTHEADLLFDDRLGPGELQALFRNPDVAILIARQGTDIVGCVAITDRPPDTAYIGMLCVDPPFQSSGLGTRLLATAERFCAGLGVGRMEMSVIDHRAELIAWYERKGWTDSGSRVPFPDNPTLRFAGLSKPVTE